MMMMDQELLAMVPEVVEILIISMETDWAAMTSEIKAMEEMVVTLGMVLARRKRKRRREKAGSCYQSPTWHHL